MRYSFDVIGDRERAVAVLEIKEGLNEKKVAKEIMKRHKSVKTVLRKVKPRAGIYRIYTCKIISGSKNTEVIHKEHGYLLKLDPKKVFFSPREATERQRIVKLVKPKERILVMFSGVAPFAIAIAKKFPETEIICIDWNLDAIKYAEKNVKLNKLSNIKNYCWDIRDARGLGKFDRILMPLPEGAYEYLDTAFACSKKGTVIHLYGIANQDFKDLIKKVKDIMKTYNIKYRIVGKEKILPYSPRRWKVRLDVKV